MLMFVQSNSFWWHDHYSATSMLLINISLQIRTALLLDFHAFSTHTEGRRQTCHDLVVERGPYLSVLSLLCTVASTAALCHNHIAEVIHKSVLPFSRTYSDLVESYQTIQEVNSCRL